MTIVMLVDLVLDIICEVYFYLMKLIIPESIHNKKIKKVVKICVTVFSMLLIFLILLGIGFLGSKDRWVMGWCLIVISLTIILIQSIVGVIIRCKVK